MKFTLLIASAAAISIRKHDIEVMQGPPNNEMVAIQQKGVPVFVVPTLLVNTEAHSDLQQRDITIDGVNGFDYVQTNSEGPAAAAKKPEAAKPDWGVNVYPIPHDHGLDDDEHDFGQKIIVDGHHVNFPQKARK